MPFLFRLKPCLLALTCVGLVGLTATTRAAESRTQKAAHSSARSTQPDRAPINSAQLLAQMMLSEIALARGLVEEAAVGYESLARQTSDPRIARRANEIELARIIQQARMKPLEAEATLARLLGRDAELRKKLLPQLPGFFARNPDKNAVAVSIHRLAAPYAQTAEAQYAIGAAERDAGRSAEAFVAASRAHALKPDWEPAMMLVLETTPDNRQQEVATDLKAFVARNPAALDARASLARWQVQHNEEAAGTALARELLAAAPDNPEVAFAMVGILVEGRDFSTAESTLQQLLDEGWGEPDRLQLILAQVQEEQGKSSAALLGYAAVPPGQYFATAQGRRARLLAAENQMPEARAVLRSAAQRSPDDRVRLLMQESLLLRQSDQRKEALGVLNEILADQPDNTDALYDSALLAEQTGNSAEMEKRLRHLLRLKPDHAHAMNALAYSLTERNTRLGEAGALLDRAIALEPEDPAILDSIGWLRFRQGRLDEAETFLRRAFAAFPDAEVAGHLIEVLWAANKKDEARQQYADALKAHPDDAILLKTGKRLGL